jgi:phage shock protein PspC (stress-responsive transcriptional regulator)
MNKRLYRSTTDRVVFGVCGGVAEYFDTDPAVIRLLMVIFALMGGTGVLFYLFAAIILQKKDDAEPLRRRQAAGASYGSAGAETYSDEFSDAARAAGEGNADAFRATDPKRSQTSGGKRSSSGAVIMGLVLIIIGVFYLINRFVPFFYWIDFRAVLAVVLVLLGIYFVAKR